MSNNQIVRSEQAHSVSLSGDHSRAESSRPSRAPAGAEVDTETRRVLAPKVDAPGKTAWGEGGDAGLANWGNSGESAVKSARLNHFANPVSHQRKDFRVRLRRLKESNQKLRERLAKFSSEMENAHVFGLEWDETLAWPKTQDRIRAEGLVRGLIHDEMNLLITCDQPDVLQKYTHLLVRLLQRIPGAVIDFVAPVGSEADQQRFDHWRAALPRKKEQAQAALRVEPFPILVIKGDETLEASSLRVLMSVPNADAETPIRAVVVMPSCPAVSEARAAFGVQYLEWAIDTKQPSSQD